MSKDKNTPLVVREGGKGPIHFRKQDVFVEAVPFEPGPAWGYKVWKGRKKEKKERFIYKTETEAWAYGLAEAWSVDGLEGPAVWEAVPLTGTHDPVSLYNRVLDLLGEVMDNPPPDAPWIWGRDKGGGIVFRCGVREVGVVRVDARRFMYGVIPNKGVPVVGGMVYAPDEAAAVLETLHRITPHEWDFMPVLRPLLLARAKGGKEGDWE